MLAEFGRIAKGIRTAIDSQAVQGGTIVATVRTPQDLPEAPSPPRLLGLARAVPLGPG